jgi:hypothetical protein
VNNIYDGAFFIQDSDFKASFYYFQINNIHDDWSHSYYEVVTDTTSAQRSFTFTINNTQEMFVSADFYDYRMYAYNCKSSYTTGLLALYSGSTQLQNVTVSDELGYGFLYFDPLPAGTYTITFKPTWTSVDVKDYTISVYALE